MKVIHVRNVPDELHAELRRRALEAGVSLSEYVLDQLRHVAERPSHAEALVRAATWPVRVERQAILDVLDEERGSA